MEHADGRAIVVIDADLQDPPEVNPLLIGNGRKAMTLSMGSGLKELANLSPK
jgi:glycosyltransferase involved in cell wall biosynthesis